MWAGWQLNPDRVLVGSHPVLHETLLHEIRMYRACMSDKVEQSLAKDASGTMSYPEVGCGACRYLVSAVGWYISRLNT